MINKREIILIEDDKLLGDLYRERFKADNIEIEVIKDGLSGYRRIVKDNPALVILDLNLTTIGGMEILNNIKKKNIQNISIIVLSAYSDQNIIDKCYNLGVKKYLYKPETSPRRLVKVVNNILNARSRQD